MTERGDRGESIAGVLKVPEITGLFWVAKLLSTALGEAASDFFVFQINPYVAVALGCAGLVGALTWQLWLKRFSVSVYWLTVAMVAIFGTMAADVLHVVLHVPYAMSAAFFAGALAMVFAAWYLSERTLSIHTVYAGRREWFYWATVMATFALGTAAGDLTAATFGLGYGASVILFAVLFALPAVGYWRVGLNEVFAFWFAYVVTRPLGASFADWVGKPYLGGLGAGDGKVAIVLIALMACTVAVLARSVPRPSARASSGSARPASD